MFPGSYLAPATVAALGAVRRCYPLEILVGASPDSTGTRATEVGPQLKFNGGNHFFAEFYNNAYPTAVLDDSEPPVPVDDGVCRLFTRLAVGTSDISLTAGYVLQTLLAVPGRIPSVSGATDVFPGAAPGIPGIPCPCLIPAGDAIYHYTKNFSDVEARLYWLWTGWDIPAAAFPDAESVWREIARHQPISPAVM